ncbi:MAG: hypothetical protein ACRD1V_16195, partial [Vicinamibacterales bacterium]
MIRAHPAFSAKCSRAFRGGEKSLRGGCLPTIHPHTSERAAAAAAQKITRFSAHSAHFRGCDEGGRTPLRDRRGRGTSIAMSPATSHHRVRLETNILRSVNMRNVVFQFVAASAITALCAAPALASPINPINSNPPVNPAIGDGPGMQSMLDSIYGCTGCVNALTGQSSAGEWQLQGSTGKTFDADLQFEFAGNASSNAFGIWSGTDTGDVTTAVIFPGPLTPV